MHLSSISALSRALFAAAAICALATAPAVAAPAVAAPAYTNVAVLKEHIAVKFRGAEASTELAKVFHDSDEAQLALAPIGALFRGDPRYHEQFGDYLSDDFIKKQQDAFETDWRRLHEIDRASLSAEEQIAYDVFEYQTRMSLEGNTPSLNAATVVRPIDHFSGVHIQFAAISGGDSMAPFKTVKDYDDGLSRMDGFIVFLDKAIGRMREGMQTHVTQPKLVVNNMIGQLDGMVAMGVDKSPFYGPIGKMPAEFSAADKTRLTAAYKERVAKVTAAFTRLRDFLKNDYLPVAREEVGLSAMPGGAALYAYLVENTTTTKMTPAEIHKLGLSEVARIKQGMEKIRQQVGFSGDLHAFFEYLRTDAKFQPASADDLRQRYAAIQQKVEAAIPRDFTLVPKTPMEVRPVPAYIEKNQAGGYYNPGLPDGSRPGVFYYNTYDLPSRHTWDNESLFLHEGIPGHHFQIALTMENEKLPAFLKFGGNTAFVEGWGLYAESLGPELGMYTDPYQMFGYLNLEMMRAMRLVVDTGIHSKGWTRDQSIQYMMDNSAMARTEVTSEVERYIAIPSQALAYKIGQLTIRRLRTKAEHELGAKFDVRGFHAQVLDSGPLPLDVLEAKIDRWIAAQKASGS